MADNVVEKNETVAANEKEEKEVIETVDDDSKSSESGDVKLKNGNKEEEDGKEKNGDKPSDVPEACPIKRKSAGGDAPDGTPAEGVSPEKKAKLDDKTETENGEEPKVAA